MGSASWQTDSVWRAQCDEGSTLIMRKKEHPGFAAIGLFYPKNPLNVGGALRAASCFGVALVAVAGRRYTPQRTDTARTHLDTPLIHVDDLQTVIPYDCVPVAVERRSDAIPLPEYIHPHRVSDIFGPENSELGEPVLRWCRDVVQIPSLYSLNLVAAVNIVLYDRLAKSNADAHG